MQPDPLSTAFGAAAETVAVLAPRRAFPTARRVAAALTAAGYETHTPQHGYADGWPAVSEREATWVQRDFLDRLAKCDAAYVIVPDRHLSRRVCLEIGAAYAAGRRIVLSETPEEPAVAALPYRVLPVGQVTG